MSRTLRHFLLVVLPQLAGLGCYYWGPSVGGNPKAVDVFSDLEREASQYGFISAGAIRVAPYDLTGLKDLREKLIKTIDDMSADFKTAPKPEQSSASLQVTEVLANLSAFYKGAPDLSSAPKALEANSDLFKALQGTLNTLFTNALSTELEANRIDLMRLRLGYLKYLDSEYTNLKLMETLPLDGSKFRRVIVSVQLTALVRRQEAQGAMVLFDLYPQHADSWAHETAAELREFRERHTAEESSIQDERMGYQYPAIWNKHIRSLRRSFFEGAQLPPEEPFSHEMLEDYEAWMHDYLIHNSLLPRIVHVEPLDVGELFNRLDLNVSSTRLGLALGTKAPDVLGVLQSAYGSTEALGDKAQLVNPLSLAFAAGDNRAGWLFLPSVNYADSPILKPTERRIRMVVDIPKGLRNVALHVHKMFTDESLRPIKAAPFDKQLAKLNQARFLLSESEKDFPKGNLENSTWEKKSTSDRVGPTEFWSRTNWELMKSRMRNILYQGWSEALSFEVLPEIPPAPIPDQTAFLEDDGDAVTAVLKGGKGLSLKNTSATLEVPVVRKNALNLPFGLNVQLPPRTLPFTLQAQEIVTDEAKGIVTMTFPSLKKWDLVDNSRLDDVRLSVSYPGALPGQKPFAIAFTLKKKEKTPGFAMSISSSQILVDQQGAGAISVTLERSKKTPAKKMLLVVKGADVDLSKIAGKKLEFTSDQTVPLTLRNLSEHFPVIISAKNEDDVEVPAVTLRVERLPEPSKKGN